MNEQNNYSDKPPARPIRRINRDGSNPVQRTETTSPRTNFFRKYGWALFGLSLLLLICVPLFFAMIEFQIKNNKPDRELAISKACDNAMQEAALVPLDQVNDAEMLIALKECQTITEFTLALNEYPSAIGFTTISDTDVQVVLEVLCFENVQEPLCVEALSTGLIRE